MITHRNMTRRAFLRTALGAGSLVALPALAGCQRPSTIPVVESGTGDAREDRSDEILGKAQIRVGMEVAYAPYNWQTSESSEYTIPVDNVSGAYADGYDVQFAKLVCEKLGGEPVAVKMTFSGLIDALNNGQIDLIIAGMSATDERRQSVDFSDPYFVGYFGLFVKEGSSTRTPPSCLTFRARRCWARRTRCSTPSSTRSPASSTRPPSTRCPMCSATCCRAPATR